jgi:hypothetical protein
LWTYSQFKKHTHRQRGRGLHKVQFFSPGCKTISNITSILSTPSIISSINNIPTPLYLFITSSIHFYQLPSHFYLQ